MKNKKSIYILLPSVLIIWGIIFWKVFSGGDDQSLQVVQPSIKPLMQAEEQIQDVMELAYNYSDPFLRSLDKPQKTTEAPEPKPVKKLNRVVRWPMVEYSGAVKSRRKKSKVGMLKISNRNFLVREKRVYKDIEVTAITPDSIGLVYQTDQRYFKRKGQTNF